MTEKATCRELEKCLKKLEDETKKRMHAEEALENEKNKLQSLSEAMDYGITIQDTDFNIIFQSGRVEFNIGGVGRKCYEVYERRETICEGCPVKMAYNDGQAHTVERRTESPSGEIAFWKNTANPIRDSRGDIVACLEITRNINERKKREDELQKLASVVRFTSDLVSLISLEGKMIFLNESGRKILDIEPDEVEQTQILKIVPNHLHSFVLEQIYPTLMENLTWEGELQYLNCKTGNAVNVNAMLYGVQNPFTGKPLYFVNVSRDVSDMLKAQSVMKQNQKKYQNIVRTSIDGYWEIEGSTGKILDVNMVYCEMSGYSREELLKMSIEDLEARESKEDLKSHLQKLRESGSDRFETIHRRKDGRLIDVEISSTYLEIEGGIILVFSRDITERKRAEEALRNQTAHLRTLIQTIPDLVWLKDPNGIYLSCNAKFERFFGAKEADIIGKTDFEFVDKELAEFFRKNDKAAIDARKPRMNEEEIIYAYDGQRALLETIKTPMYDSEGNLVGVLGIARDITDRRQAERNVLRLATAIEQADALVVITDKNGSIEYVNSAFERVTGYSCDEAVGENLRILKSGKQDEHFYSEMWDTILEGRVWKGRLTNRKKDGALYEEHATIAPVKDDSGEIVNFVTVKRDVTREVQLERRIFQAQKMEAIGTLAGGVAHDFNNILGVIVGYTEFAIESAEPGSSLQYDLHHVLNAAMRAKDLVKQILTFSRETEQEKRPINLKLAILEALILLRASLPTTIEIKQNLQSEALVMIDSTQVHQIMMNLCSNARHAMRKQGGIIRVALESVVLGGGSEIKHQGIMPGPYVVLTISDTGHGMDQETKDRIFDPFFTTKEKSEGTGMGLSVVHGIVKSCGGAINVYSEPGEGSSFELFFPAIEGKLDQEARIEKPIPKGTEHILLVDDEPFLLELLKKLFESLGYKATARTSSVEALELFKSEPEKFDLVITDMTMPIMTGETLAQKIMAIRADIPIILCTGFNERITEDIVKRTGIRKLVFKPIIKRDIAEIVRVVLDEYKGSGRNRKKI